MIFVCWPVIEKLCGLAQPEPAVQPEPAPAKSKQPKRRRRRKKVQPAPAPVVSVEPDEKSNLGHEIILAIIHHAHPGGYAHVRTSDLERLVHAPGALEAECKKRGVDRKQIMAGRHAIELATGRRERRKKS